MEDNRNRVKVNKRVAPKDNSFITGTGQTIVNVHAESEDCRTYGCVIHNPSDNCMSSFPSHWRTDRGIMERICPCGIGHIDVDQLNFIRRTKGEKAAYYESIHGCCGIHCHPVEDYGDFKQ